MIKALHLWLPAYLRRRPMPVVSGVTDILLCLCDHFEPFHGATPARARERVNRWQTVFPANMRDFRDADGCHPRHTFFYPIEQYAPDIIQPLAELCHAGWGETEIHLHHKDDTADHLRQTIEEGKTRLATHGLLCRDPENRLRYGFIHGNWALDNSDPTGRNCGVNDELSVLKSTGCYADFTMPSAPHPTQTRIVNSLYYATDTPLPKSHDTGLPVKAGRRDDPPSPGCLWWAGGVPTLGPRSLGESGGMKPEAQQPTSNAERRTSNATLRSGDPSSVAVSLRRVEASSLRSTSVQQPTSAALRPSGHLRSDVATPTTNHLPPTTQNPKPLPPPSPEALLMVQGPLALNWRRRKFGFLPRIENGELSGINPPTADRFRLWLDTGIHVEGRPEWLFIKLHTHGCDEARGNLDMLLGEPFRRFHRELAAACNDGRRYRLHYVTARELVNVVHAAEDGRTGNPGEFRDYRYR